ncbi:MAG TPA: ankyrin repeat domain-containing protein [Candidatus Koribacter sp.]|jgi:ankyrin repeat protein
MSPRELPARPNLEHLKNQARTLLDEALASDASALARFSNAGVTDTPKLADALHVIAREYGFETWPKLKAHVEAASEDPVEALASAIRANDGALVRTVLSRHGAVLKPLLNDPLPGLGFDATAVVAASHRENREMMDALLDAGADINSRSRWWAGGYGVLDACGGEFAEYLLSRGAKLDAHAAARFGKIDALRTMLAHDPQLVHARGGDGQLPLHFAATLEIAKLLLENGAEIDARDIDHESTAAQYMACFGRYESSPKDDRHEIVRYLLSRGAQPDILMAAAVGERALVERLLNEDPDNAKFTASEKYFPKRDPKSGGCIYIYGFGITQTPHALARKFGHHEVFELLMQRSAPWLRLIQAAETGDEAMVRKVMEKHPGVVNRLPGNAAVRIVSTAIRNNTQAVELLIEAGWPTNPALPDNGQTALHYAAWHGNAAMVRVLLAKGAEVNRPETQHGGNPLGWALHGSLNSWERNKGDYPAVVRALVAAGAVLPKEQFPIEPPVELMKILAEHGLLSAESSRWLG